LSSRRRFLSTSAISAGAFLTTHKVKSGNSNNILRGIPETYKAYEIGNQVGPDSLRMVERQVIMPVNQQVLIKVKTSSINARDHGLISNRFPVPKGPRPNTRVPLSEGAGTVVAIGKDVKNISIGDRVTACHFSSWVKGPWDPRQSYIGDIGNNVDGWLAEFALIPSYALVKLPPSVLEESAATFVSSGVTAWHALYEVARVKPGDIVVSLGTGGVSSFGVQLAKSSGARVIVTSSSDKKLREMIKQGADEGINYKKNPEWGNEIIRLTEGKGANITLENVGRRTLDQSLIGSAVNGFIVMIGTERLPDELPKMPGFYMKNITMKAISNANVSMLNDMVQAYAVNGLNPIISKRFKFEEAPDAFRYQKMHKKIGKVVIQHYS
jgi:NADPH:quinone reductase-like Zn-dependent oxidoreductase